MLGILSDAHGNAPAFRVAISLLTRLGATNFVFLGDAIGYIPLPTVLESLIEMKSSILCIRGNHEDMLLRKNIDLKRDAVYQLNLIKRTLSKDALQYLTRWQASFEKQVSAGRVLFVHGSPNDPTDGYVYPDSDLSIYKTSVDYVFMGNSHYPFVRHCGTTTFVNVGSCGLPRDDGRYGAAVLFNETSGEIRLIRFDITKVTAPLLSGNLTIHQSVRETFARKREDVYGEIL